MSRSHSSPPASPPATPPDQSQGLANGPADPAAEGWTAFPVKDGFADHIGPLWRKLGPDGAKFGFRADRRHINANGVVHGGMLLTFADHALGSIVFEIIERKPCATVTLSGDFIGPGRNGQWIEASGEITRKTRSLVFIRGTVSSEGQTLLTVDGIWKVLGQH